MGFLMQKPHHHRSLMQRCDYYIIYRWVRRQSYNNKEAGLVGHSQTKDTSLVNLVGAVSVGKVFRVNNWWRGYCGALFCPNYQHQHRNQKSFVISSEHHHVSYTRAIHIVLVLARVHSHSELRTIRDCSAFPNYHFNKVHNFIKIK